MKTYFETRVTGNFTGKAFAGLFALCFFAFAVSAQAPPNPVPPQESIQTGALIIPMDNFHQGTNTFNLRAYGLANLMLQNNIPVKWAIRPGKDKDDTDFSANVTRIAGLAGIDGPGDASFSGGPFIITREFDTPAVRNLIASFNTGGAAVTVYRTNAAISVDIRYTLTHKPKIAIGPDGGNLGSGVYQDLFTSAGIGDFESVTDNIVNASACFTIAMQAHSTDSEFVQLYRDFAESGGNLVLQCASIDTFENNPAGLFQTTLGYSVFGTNDGNAVDTPLLYPVGAMPFNQFIGELANQIGAVTEYAYAPGSIAANGNLVSVRNTGIHADKFVATVSQLLAGDSGGHVFELGGHDYTLNNTGASEIAKLNGQRMALNTIFVPVTRPAACGPDGGTANVLGFKSVRRQNIREGGPQFVAGDTVRWTIDYVNNGPLNVANFQVRDIIQANLDFVEGSVVVTPVGFGTAAVANPLYDGVGDDATSDFLLPNAFLPVNGRIRITFDTIIIPGTPNGTVLLNQTTASGSSLDAASEYRSDAIDSTNITILGVPPPPADSATQIQNGPLLDPTRVIIKGGPTAATASIEGQVRDANGVGISKAVIRITNATTSASRTVVTNGFGFYNASDLRAGDLYVVSVSHKRYRFATPFVSFTLNDNVTGLAFVASASGVSGSKVSAVKR